MEEVALGVEYLRGIFIAILQGRVQELWKGGIVMEGLTETNGVTQGLLPSLFVSYMFFIIL